MGISVLRTGCLGGFGGVGCGLGVVLVALVLARIMVGSCLGLLLVVLLLGFIYENF